MDKPRVSCPECGAVFEIQEEYRGEEVDCPKCSVLFQIPLTGSVGQRISDGQAAPAAPVEDAAFEVACPHCRTIFEVPGEYRNELAECSECNGVFRIPATGSQGEVVPEDQLPPLEPEPEPPPPAPTPSQPPALEPPPQFQPPAEITGTGIQQETVERSTKRTGTVRLSRKAVVGNTMTPQPKSDEQIRQESERRIRSGVFYDPVTGEVTHQTISDPIDSDGIEPLPDDALIVNAASMPSEPGKSTSKGKKKHKRVRVVTLPTWVQGMELEEDEEIRGCALARKTVSFGQLFITLLPVLAIPLACLASIRMGVPTSAIVFTIVGAAFWGIHALTVFAFQSKKALIVTTERAILITADEILKVDIDRDEDG